MKKLSEEEIDVLLNKVGAGEKVIAHCVPTRAFRVIMIADEKTFRVEQLVRQAGDKWVPLSTHTDDLRWKAYKDALDAAILANRNFLLEMRKIKVERNQALRAAQAGKTLHVPDR
jgi:hypothetical protein